LSYRKSEFTRLNARNRGVLAGMEQGNEVKILRNSNISAVKDEDGRPRVTFKEADLPERVFDRVVFALGGSTPVNFLRTLGISFSEEGASFDASGETNIPGLFVLGDLVVGQHGGSIITAFNSAVHAMRRICEAHLPCSGGRPGGPLSMETRR
jgi:thioredoxin reductase (NADPH)